MKSLVKTLFAALFMLFLHSCSSILMKKDVANTPTHCFNSMWQTVDEKYSFFEYKNIDWNAIKIKYQAQINDTMSQDSLYRVLSAMLYELNDGHVNLSAQFNRSRNWTWMDKYPANYNGRFVQRRYLGDDFHITGALMNQILPDSVGYIRYSSFSSPVTDKQLDYVLKRFDNCKGLILDVRDNGGGAMSNVFKFLGHFTDKKVHVGFVQSKNGKAHNAFSTPDSLFAKPKKKGVIFTKPIVLLINRGSYSATTHLAGFMSILPNVTLVGDRAGGGGGFPISADLPNGWQYRFSASRQFLPDGSDIEHGVAPDVEASTSAADELENRDAVIEKAIQIILGKK